MCILDGLTHSSEAIVVNDVGANVLIEVVHLHTAVGLIQITLCLQTAV